MVRNEILPRGEEPTSALDVSVQAQILNLLKSLQRDLELTFFFISHDLNMIRYISDRIFVMYLGKIVEMGRSEDIFENPQHPYTKALTSANPVPDPDFKKEMILLTGEVPSPINPPSGCRFHTRCPYAFDRCMVEEPELKEIGGGNRVACFLHS